MAEVLRGLTDKSLAANGYQELPGGLIMQWGNGSASITSGAGTTNTPMYQGGMTVTFPKAFPNGALVITATPKDNPNILMEYVNVASRTKTTFTVFLGGIQNQGTVPSPTTVVFDWIAIGY